MDENTRRQITWAIIIGVIGIITITAGYRRGELKSLANVIADGTPAQRIEAVRTLIEKQKLTEALDEQPRWVQDNAVAAVAYLGDNDALLETIGSCWMLDKPVVPRAVDQITNRNRSAITPLVEAMQDKDGNVRGGTSAPLIAIGPPVITPLLHLVSAWDQYVRDGIVAVYAGVGAPAAPALIPIMQQKAPRGDQTPAEFLRAKDTARKALVAMKVPALGPIMKELLVVADPELRADAAAMVGEIDATAGVPLPEIQKTVAPLLSLLNTDPAWAVRRKAATALGGLAKNADQFGATPSLLARLADSRNEVKAAAAEALGKVGNPIAAGPLASTLVNNRVGAVREISVALLTIGKPAIPALLSSLSSSEEEVRQTGTETIGQIGGPDAVVPLAGMLKDRSDAIREIAADALRGLADGRAVPALIAALDDQDWRVYHAARDGLVKVGQPAVSPLVAALGSSNPRTSHMVEQALAKIGGPAVPQLTAALSSGNAVVADWAGVALGDIGNDAVEPVAAVLENPGASVSAHAAAARALGRCGVSGAVKPLTDAFHNAPSQVQVAIVNALDALSAADGTETLVAALQVSSQDVREAAMHVLRNWRIGDVQKSLTQVLQVNDQDAKRRAAIVLAQQGSSAAQELLAQAAVISADKSQQDLSSQLRPILEGAVFDVSETKSVRMSAVRALGYLGMSESLPQLQKLLTPGDVYAAEAAKSVALIGRRVLEQQGQNDKANMTQAAQLLVELLKSTPDDKLRFEVAVALSTMRSQPVKALLDGFITAQEDVKPWIAATLGAIGKPATDPVLDVRGVTKNADQKSWCAATLRLIGDAQALDLLKHLSDEDQPDPTRVAAGQKILDQIRAGKQ